MLVAGSGGGSVTRTITTANSGSTSETAQFVTPAGTLQTTAAATTTITHNGQANVTEIAYNVTGSSDPAIAAGTGVAHIANFAPVVGLSYTDFGAWSVDTSTSTSNPPTYLGVFAGGKPGQNTTATSGMPTSGSATFSGGAAGYASQPDVSGGAAKSGTFYGNASLTANFAGGTIVGTISGINVYGIGAAGSSPSIGTINDVKLSGSISGSSLSGTTSAGTNIGTAINAVGATGSFNGAFYGPAAQEAAGTFTLSGGTHNVIVQGAFGVK